MVTELRHEGEQCLWNYEHSTAPTQRGQAAPQTNGVPPQMGRDYEPSMLCFVASVPPRQRWPTDPGGRISTGDSNRAPRPLPLSHPFVSSESSNVSMAYNPRNHKSAGGHATSTLEVSGRSYASPTQNRPASRKQDGHTGRDSSRRGSGSLPTDGRQPPTPCASSLAGRSQKGRSFRWASQGEATRPALRSDRQFGQPRARFLFHPRPRCLTSHLQISLHRQRNWGR